VRSWTLDPDPAVPVPSLGGGVCCIGDTVDPGSFDQRPIEARIDVLVYTSEPLDEPLDATGPVEVVLYVSSDARDTDFTVKLTDVYPDGRSMLLTDGIRRARFRESFEEARLMEPGKVYELTVDLWSTSIVFNRGHKIRVAVSSSNAPRFDPNPNTGRPLRADDETRVATNTLHVSSRYPSHVILPRYAGPEEGSLPTHGKEQ